MIDLDNELRRAGRALERASLRVGDEAVPHAGPRRRVRRPIVAGVAIACLLTVGVVATAVVIAHDPSDSGVRTAPEIKTGPTQVPPLTFAAGVPETVDAAAPEPTSFLAAIGGGSERVAVLSTATGRVERYVTPEPGSQTLAWVSADQRTVYRTEGCVGNPTASSRWTAYDVATGASRAVFEDLPAAAVAESPDGAKLAYLRGCGPGIDALVVRDVASGRERVWTGTGLSDPQGGSAMILGGSTLTWSPDSTRVLVSARPATIQRSNPFVSVLWVVDINRGTSVSDGVPLIAPDPTTCTVTTGVFRAGTNDVLGAMTCGLPVVPNTGANTVASVVAFDATTGTTGQVQQVASGEFTLMTGIAVDASGQHVLVNILTPNGGQVLVLRGGNPVQLASDTYGVWWR